MNRPWLAATLLLGATTTVSIAAGDITYYEAPVLTWDGGAKADVPPARLQFRAFERDFDLRLTSHEGLLEHLDPEKSRAAEQDAWHARGRLGDQPGSWVRLSRVGDDFLGAIWDGAELFLMDSGDVVGAPAVALAVYRADALQRPRHSDLVLTPPDHAIRDRVKDEITQSAAKSAGQRLNVSIVADRQFAQQNGNLTSAAVMARMNVVDGIYSQQVGVQLYVSHLEILTSNGSMTATNPSDLLNQFVDFYRASSLPQPGIAHLFSGKNFDGSTVGVAYLGVLCSRNYGFGINEVRGSGAAGALIVAHEIGHNFDAPHDNSSQCDNGATRGIMNSSLNGSTEFSQCSLGFMTDEVDRAVCLVDVDDIFDSSFE